MLDFGGLRLAPVDYLILSLYFVFVLSIGWIVKRRVATSDDFLASGRSVPVWITSLAILCVVGVVRTIKLRSNPPTSISIAASRC
jgi:SSS family solute:Na+ symporter